MQGVKPATIEFLPWGLGLLEQLHGMDAMTLKEY